MRVDLSTYTSIEADALTSRPRARPDAESRATLQNKREQACT